MTASALISGQLFGEVLTRPTRTGGQFTAFKIKVATGNEVQWWNVTTFSDTCREELEGLDEGDALAAVGALEVATYEKDEQTRISLRLTAERVLALKQRPKERTAQPKAREQPHAARAPARIGTRPINRERVAAFAARNGQAKASGATGSLFAEPPPAPPPIDDEIPF
jgi:single-stranded DNA-binding protein